MPIDVTRDELIPLPKAASKYLPDPPGPAGLWRWHAQGVLINGKRIKLETVRCGRSRYTTEAAFKLFIDRMNPTVEPAADQNSVEERLRRDPKLRKSIA